LHSYSDLLFRIAGHIIVGSSSPYTVVVRAQVAGTGVTPGGLAGGSEGGRFSVPTGIGSNGRGAWRAGGSWRGWAAGGRAPRGFTSLTQGASTRGAIADVELVGGRSSLGVACREALLVRGCHPAGRRTTGRMFCHTKGEGGDGMGADKKIKEGACPSGEARGNG